MKLEKIQPRRAVDGNVTATQNERKVLLAVRHFGHLRIAEIARINWPSAASRESALESARRTVRRLLLLKQLKERTNTLGERSLVLSTAGAARLQAELEVAARDGYDIYSVRGGTFYHRTLCTAYLAERAAEGDKVWGEYALSKEWSPFTYAQLEASVGKRPDGLVRLAPSTLAYRGIASRTSSYYDIVETESGPKSDLELDKVLSVALRLDNQTFDRLVLVYEADSVHERKILRSWQRVFKAAQLDTPNLDEHLLAGYVELARMHLAKPLKLVRLERVMLADVLTHT